MTIKQFPSAVLTEKQTREMILISDERYLVIHDRQQAIKVMKALYEIGYRWIVRDLEMDVLSLFSCKPKKYLKLESWGYTDSDLRTDKSMMCESIKNTDITEIRWQNRQPTNLEQFIKDNEETEDEGN